MVFSQTSLNTHSALKVVELNRLKGERKEVGIGASSGTPGDDQRAPAPTTSSHQVFLKPEPQLSATMFNELDSEFFQDLHPWCGQHTAVEAALMSTDPMKTKESSLNTDTLHTLSPGGDFIDPISPTAAGLCASTPTGPLSPKFDAILHADNYLYTPEVEQKEKMEFDDPMWDINALPVVFGDVEVERSHDFSAVLATGETNTHYTQTNTNDMFQHKDFLDMKDSITLSEENGVVVEDFFLEQKPTHKTHSALRLNLAATAEWVQDVLGTPDVVRTVEALKEKYPLASPSPVNDPLQWPAEDDIDVLPSVQTELLPEASLTSYYAPETPAESHAESDEDIKPRTRRKRRCSEDSDKTYVPHVETPKRTRGRGKSNVSLTEMIHKLSEAQPPKAPRGRPRKRKDSIESLACSVDDNSSAVSTHEVKYRELRDKNNEASKRSRMNRKLKELQMEQQAEELEEKNRKLQVKADILEEMRNKLKDALMTAMLHK